MAGDGRRVQVGVQFFQIGGQGAVRERKTKWSPGLGSSQNGQNGLIHQTDAMVGAGSHQPLLPCPRKNPCNTFYVSLRAWRMDILNSRIKQFTKVSSKSSGCHYFAMGSCGNRKGLFQAVIPRFSMHNLFHSTADGFKSQDLFSQGSQLWVLRFHL